MECLGGLGGEDASEWLILRPEREWCLPGGVTLFAFRRRFIRKPRSFSRKGACRLRKLESRNPSTARHRDYPCGGPILILGPTHRFLKFPLSNGDHLILRHLPPQPITAYLDCLIELSEPVVIKILQLRHILTRFTPIRCMPTRCTPMKYAAMRCMQMRYAHEVRAMRCIHGYEVHVSEMHAHETHAGETHAR